MATTTDTSAAAAPTTTLGAPPAEPTPPAAATAAPHESTKPEAAKVEAKAAELELKFEGVEVDATTVGEFKTLAKEFGLDSPKAQKLADLYVGLQSKAAQAAEAAAETRRSEWLKALESDKDIGGDKLKGSVDVARRAVAKFGGRELAQALDASGLGDHPAVVKAFAAIGRAMAEDSISGTAVPPAPKGRDGLLSLFTRSPEMFSKE